jgi:hypothetical protein
LYESHLFSSPQLKIDSIIEFFPILQPPKQPLTVKQRKPPGYTARARNEENQEAKPDGTVTLTQDELTSILTSLGKVSKDHPLRISIGK